MAGTICFWCGRIAVEISGQTYPISRGNSPLLVALGAALFAGEIPDAISMVGVGLVSVSISSLAFQGQKLGSASLPYALATGCFIAAYSVTDGIGVRLSGTPAGYAVWMCLLWGLMAPLVCAAVRDWRSLRRGSCETWVAAGGGIVSLAAYGIIILAMSLGAMGPVSALCETSVVFATLIGRVSSTNVLPLTGYSHAASWRSAQSASAVASECRTRGRKFVLRVPFVSSG